MPASREKDERMWELADKLARSGEFSGWLPIEQELRSLGFFRARQLLDDERIRQRLDSISTEAKRRPDA
jgi:hypothetical protein